jgi:hypothetical protein
MDEDFKLTMAQLLTIHNEARRGVSLFDGAILAGLTEEQAEAAMKLPQVRQAFLSGRAEGAKLIRARLTEQANAGNVSAMKCLKLHQSDPEPPEREYTPAPRKSPAEERRDAEKWQRDFNKRWARISELNRPRDEGDAEG